MDQLNNFDREIIKQLTGSSKFSDEDFAFLLEHDAELKQQYLSYQQLWNLLGDSAIRQQIDVGSDWQQLNKKIRNQEKEIDPDIQIPGKKYVLRTVIKYAAVLLLGFFISFLVFKQPSSPKILLPVQTELCRVEVPRGQRTTMVLPDGTKVWINSGSTITYLRDFVGKTREVKLEGEAYFDVAKDKAHPFIVHTQGLNITALGTAFNVKSYGDDRLEEAVLERGSIRVIKNNAEAEDAVILVPNQKVTLRKGDDKLKVKDINNSESNLKSIKEKETVEYSSWKEEKLIFGSETFDNIAKVLERWYNVNIYIPDDSLRTYRYTGKFTNNETLEQVLQIIELTTPLEIHRSGNSIVVRRKLK